MSLDVNGERRQTGNTKTMIFGIAHCLHYISQFMVLEPGDVVTTGTPPGVALGMKPPKWLNPGDVDDAEDRGPRRAEEQGRAVQGVTRRDADRQQKNPRGTAAGAGFCWVSMGREPGSSVQLAAALAPPPPRRPARPR